MAVMTDKAIFYHIPKTAGSWARLAIEAAGLSSTELPCINCGPETAIRRGCCGHGSHMQIIPPSDGKERFRFTFIRHPLALYQSYWAYKMHVGWKPKNDFDTTVYSEDFSVFVRNVVERYPGWATKCFEQYVGPEASPHVHFVGRQERIRDDLIEVLTRAGESINIAAIRALPPNNVVAQSPEWREKCVYTPKMHGAVLQAEADAIRRFYPHGIPDLEVQ